ncbi:hypothetical protein [Nostoc sp.]|uniref:hypothetical protein n=1 Tax=Nostoc sp. TaxID=1180 RepID=UPI002FF5E125
MMGFLSSTQLTAKAIALKSILKKKSEFRSQNQSVGDSDPPLIAQPLRVRERLVDHQI